MPAMTRAVARSASERSIDLSWLIAENIEAKARAQSTILERLAVDPGAYVLLTIHRQANVEPGRLAAIVAAVNETGRPTIFPAHPRTRHHRGTARAPGPPGRASHAAPVGSHP